MSDQHYNEGEERFNQRPEDFQVDEDDEESESDDEDGDGSDGRDGSDGSDGSEEDEPTAEELKQFMLTFSKDNYDNDIEDALSAYHSRIATTDEVIDLYNKPPDWMERNAIGLENLKKQLEKHTGSAMEGKQYLFFDHGDDHEEPVVWHDPSINPYWEQLTTAFQNPTIENAQYLGIYVKNVEMPKEIVAALVSTVCGGRAINSIHSVHFINTNLCGEGIVLLSTLVQSTPELRYFYLRDNRIDDMNSALCLSRALKLHPRMRLDMSHCDLGNDPDTLSVILQSNVEGISLSHNNID